MTILQTFYPQTPVNFTQAHYFSYKSAIILPKNFNKKKEFFMTTLPIKENRYADFDDDDDDDFDDYL
jgi:hypothetical protein